ncbi:unnamed protein product [Fraxinus pennsylvanica]|uniref:Malic enzyme NAD-binding domain-containing protein n=1 Tax=Fraxinus pennsylvanica TaxID=56036 RepID=A0AAD1YY77_9LAMI|nr:unnamed protein product [Fraxinus pennsylvanica]
MATSLAAMMACRATTFARLSSPGSAARFASLVLYRGLAGAADQHGPAKSNSIRLEETATATLHASVAIATRDAVAGSSGATIFPAMKKAKFQSAACSLDSNRNGQQSIKPYVYFADTPAHFPMIEDDPNDVLEGSFSSERGAAAVGSHEVGTIANLSRKKATPPQPAKRLVLKLNKGNGKIGHVNQANNMYLFPGIGLGALLTGARIITDGMLQTAAE